MKLVEIGDDSEAVAGGNVEVAVMIMLINVDELVVAYDLVIASSTLGGEFADIGRLQFVQGLQLIDPKLPKNPAAQKLHNA